MPKPSVDVAGVLAEAVWLTRLARSRTGNSPDEADVVQATFAAALRSPPDPELRVRPWLRRVYQHRADTPPPTRPARCAMRERP